MTLGSLLVHAALSAPRRSPARPRSIVQVNFISVRTQLPDADRTVLVYMPHSESDPVWLGYYDDELGGWRSVDAAPLHGKNRVTHWADIPVPFLRPTRQTKEAA